MDALPINVNFLQLPTYLTFLLMDSLTDDTCWIFRFDSSVWIDGIGKYMLNGVATSIYIKIISILRLMKTFFSNWTFNCIELISFVSMQRVSLWVIDYYWLVGIERMQLVVSETQLACLLAIFILKMFYETWFSGEWDSSSFSIHFHKVLIY